MRAGSIEVSQTYAYCSPGSLYGGVLLAATVISRPRGGEVEVEMHHPDVASWRDTVPTRTLVGRWDSAPADVTDPGWTHAESKPHRPGEAPEKHTFAETQAIAYGKVCRQRERARRLTALGFPRAEKTYAGIDPEGEEAAYERKAARREAGLAPLSTSTTSFSVAEVEEIMARLEAAQAIENEAEDV